MLETRAIDKGSVDFDIIYIFFSVFDVITLKQEIFFFRRVCYKVEFLRKRYYMGDTLKFYLQLGELP